MKTLFLLSALSLFTAVPSLPAADGGDVKGMRIEPATTSVAVLGKARLSVELLTRGDGGLHGPYKVDVVGLPSKGEAGEFTITLAEADFDKLANGQSLNFGGKALSKDGNTSTVRGTASPSSGEGGAIKVKVDSKKGRLVFKTTYRLTR